MSMITLHPATADRAARLQVVGALTIYCAADVRAELLQLWPTLPDGPLDIDLDQVDEADTAAVQLLVALGHSLLAAGRYGRVVACSPPLRLIGQALGAIDAHHCFGMPESPANGAPH